jgi:shikimate kinase
MCWNDSRQRRAGWWAAKPAPADGAGGCLGVRLPRRARPQLHYRGRARLAGVAGVCASLIEAATECRHEELCWRHGCTLQGSQMEHRIQTRMPAGSGISTCAAACAAEPMKRLETFHAPTL